MSGRTVVFCSHASADKPQVLAFAARLRADGFDAWVDGMEIGGGDDLVEKINDGLGRATAGLIFFSRHIDQALWARSEINYLTHQAVQGLRVIPVMIDDDASVPPLLTAYLRRPIEAYEAIRDDLLDHRDRVPMGTLPDRSRAELLVQLTSVSDGVRTRAWLSGTQLADTTRRLPPLLDPSYTPAQTDSALTAVGRDCGTLLFSGAAASEVEAILAHHRPGDRLDVVVEAGPELLRLPFETARLPVTGWPLLIAMDGLTLARRPLGPPARLTPALAPPLKILAAVAAPDEGTTASSVLDGERELARILDAQPDAAQVRPLEVAGLADITAALKRDEYHVLHLSGHGSVDGIELEDEDGHAVLVTPDKLASAIRDAGRPLPLLFLSCCDPPSGAGTTRGLAERLLDAGLSQIIAMNGSVTDSYATALASKFYQELADAPDRDPAAALAHARRALERERRQAAEQGVVQRPEYSAATVFCAGVPQPVVRPGRPKPLLARPPLGTEALVPLLGVDDLVGRRPEVRTAVRALAGPDHQGVTLCGMGGVGKSTVAGRVMQRMVDRGWVVATVAGVLNLPGLCAAVRDALDSVDGSGAQRLVTQLGEEDADDKLRIGRLTRALREHRLLLVLDNFEDNLRPGGESFTEAATEALLGQLVAAATSGRVLITSRYPVPAAASLLDIRLVPLSSAQTGKLLLRLPGLTQADSHAIFRLTGGHPRLLELVDAALRGDTNRLRSMTDRLQAYATEQGIDLSAPRKDLATAVADAIIVELRDIALNDLVAELTASERDVLLQVSVSTIPISTAMITDTLENDLDVAPVLRRLARFSLLTPVGKKSFVERWTAEGLRDLTSVDDWRARLRRVAARRLQPQDGMVDVADAMEAVRNLIEATDFDEAGVHAARICVFLRTRRQLVTISSFAGDCLADIPLTASGAPLVAEAETDANMALGLTSAAKERWVSVTAVLSDRAKREPGNASYQHDLSVAYTKLGDLEAGLGHGEQVLRYHRQSLGIAQQLAAREPDNANYQRDLAISYERLGDRMADLGHSQDALRYHRQSLDITRQLAAREPHRTEYQRDLAVAYNKIGGRLISLGRAQDAVDLFQNSLDITQQLATREPGNADRQRDVAISCERLGGIVADLGQSQDAIRYQQQGLDIRKRLVAQEPNRTEYQRDLCVSYNKLGELMISLGRSQDALRLFQQSLDIAHELSAREPNRADYQRDISVAYERLGDIMFQTGQEEDALAFHQQSLDIAERLAALEPDRTDYQRDLFVSYERLVDLMAALGRDEEALRYQRQALDIARQLATSEPDRADHQRDLAIAYAKLGDLVADLHNDEALHYRKLALEITRQLAKREPDRANYQRDLAISYERMAARARADGDTEEARSYLRDALAIRSALNQQEPDRVDLAEELATTLCLLIEITGEIEPGASRVTSILTPFGKESRITPKGTKILNWLERFIASANS
ncbi:tetratricopeptide repeat protein [Amycolatopsis sp. cg9]|uniref:tetratricopeptide repeat protein n=1 Tax=Amycolatopsis sp. cg9 TaxID=3238801 RepID=UPI003524FB3C